jgi:ribonucleoside-triphosphate reductase
MRTIESISEEISGLQERLEKVRGTETEVYTRIVGYYRSLRNWNKGKREEYNQRLTFDVSAESGTPAPAACQEKTGPRLEEIAGYGYFYRKTCPNCPPVRDFVNRLPLEGAHIDVDTEEGFDKARAHDVQSTPTVVFYDRQGRAKHRYHSVRQLEEVLAVLNPGFA